MLTTFRSAALGEADGLTSVLRRLKTAGTAVIGPVQQDRRHRFILLTISSDNGISPDRGVIPNLTSEQLVFSRTPVQDQLEEPLNFSGAS